MNELIQQPSVELMLAESQAKRWELMQRKAQAYSTSSIVPAQYRAQIEKKEYGVVVGYEPNPSGLANCIVAINMAERMKADEMMVMQNLYIIEGRPSWSSQWVMAMINGCGKFSPLRFKLEDLGIKEVDYIEYVYNKTIKKREPIAKKITVHDFSCVAYATDKSSGVELESSKVSIEIAVKEGWYTKAGSKWQTMPEMMLRYRSASFFGSIYAPELKMGLMTVEECQDMPVDLSIKYPDSIPTNQSEQKIVEDLPDESGQESNHTNGEPSAGDFEINPEAQKQADLDI